MANTSVGLAMATTGTPFSMRMGSTMWCRAVASGIRATAARSIGELVEIDELQTHLLGHRPTRSSSVAKCWL